MDYLTYSLCLSFQEPKYNTSLLRNLEKHSVAVPLVHADVLSSLATRPNLNSSKLNLSPLSPPQCIFISHPRNVVLLLCACVNRGRVRTLRIEAGGRRGFTVMSIKEKQNMAKGQSTAARADPTLNRLLTCLSCWIPGKHDRGTGIRFPAKKGGGAGLMSSGRRLFLTFNLSGQVGDTCDSCLYCTPHIWGRENKTDCKQTETLTFFIIQCLFQTLVLFCKQLLPPKNRQASNNQQHSQFSLYELLLTCFHLLEFPLFQLFFLNYFYKTEKNLTCSINNKTVFFLCLLLCIVLCWNVCVWSMNAYAFNPSNYAPFSRTLDP